MLTHSKQETARIIGQIQGCYNNRTSLIRPTVNQIEFEKAIQEDKTAFYFEDVIKSYSSEILSKVESEKDEVKKSEILTKSNEQLSSLEKINVVFDNMVKSIYVDVIDINTNTYKDSAINRKLDRVASVVVGRELIEKGGEGSKGGKVIGHTKSGKPIYAHKDANHEHYKNFTPSEHREAAEFHEKEFRKHEEVMDKTKGNTMPTAAFKHAERAEGHHNQA